MLLFNGCCGGSVAAIEKCTVICGLGNNLLRVTQYVPEKRLPLLDIELIHVPGRDRVLSKLSIRSVQLDFLGKKKRLDFYDSQAAIIEKVNIENGVVQFRVFYVFSGKAAPSVLFACEVNANLDKLPQPQCHAIKRKD